MNVSVAWWAQYLTEASASVTSATSALSLWSKSLGKYTSSCYGDYPRYHFDALALSLCELMRSLSMAEIPFNQWKGPDQETRWQHRRKWWETRTGFKRKMRGFISIKAGNVNSTLSSDGERGTKSRKSNQSEEFSLMLNKYWCCVTKMSHQVWGWREGGKRERALRASLAPTHLSCGRKRGRRGSGGSEKWGKQRGRQFKRAERGSVWPSLWMVLKRVLSLFIPSQHWF